MVLVTVDGKTVVVVRGPGTGPSEADYPAEAEYLGITFGLGAFMPHLPVRALLARFGGVDP